MDDEAHRTRSAVLGLIDEAGSRQRHDLIVAPPAPFLSYSQGKESDDLKDFADLARQHKTFLAVALMEEAKDGRTFCTALLLDRQGKIAGKYRKTHALPDDNMALGDDLPVFKTEIGAIGLSLGSDIYFPEIYTVEWMKGRRSSLIPVTCGAPTATTISCCFKPGPSTTAAGWPVPTRTPRMPGCEAWRSTPTGT